VVSEREHNAPSMQSANPLNIRIMAFTPPVNAVRIPPDSCPVYSTIQEVSNILCEKPSR
jgi:hypothetical protein